MKSESVKPAKREKKRRLPIWARIIVILLALVLLFLIFSVLAIRFFVGDTLSFKGTLAMVTYGGFDLPDGFAGMCWTATVPIWAFHSFWLPKMGPPWERRPSMSSAEASCWACLYEKYICGVMPKTGYVAEDFKGDLIITENGIATADDNQRIAFIKGALDGVEKCIADGLPVKGYLYWTLLDNFEWMLGFGSTFGLIAVDRATPRKAWHSLAARNRRLQMGGLQWQ